MAPSAPGQLSMEECHKLLCRPGTIFEMEDVHIDGVTMRAWANAPISMRHLLKDRFVRFSANLLVSSPLPDPQVGRERLTYGEVYARALQLAAWLMVEKDVHVGTRVAIGGANCTDWIVSFVAVHLLGAVPVLLNPVLVDDLQIHCLALSKPRVSLVDSRLALRLGKLTGELSKRGIRDIFCWSSLSHLSASERGTLQELHPHASERDIRDVKDGFIHGIETLNPESDCMIMFTSGTTSKPKGVLVSQRGVVSHHISSACGAARGALRSGADLKTALSRYEPTPKPQVMLMVIPLFHVSGLLSWLVKGMTKGDSVVFVRRWNVDEAVHLMMEEGVTAVGGVPAIATALVNNKRLPNDFVINGVYYGGAMPPKSLAQKVQARWPMATVSNGYGMTEMNGIVTTVVGKDYVNNPHTTGPAIPIADIRIVDPETRELLPAGKPGLIFVRGSMCMKEYVANPDATREAFAEDGWYNTGDLGYLDPEGWLQISDRQKDMIIRGGENIASAEVEHAIHLDHRIADAAAVPVPDELMGELVGVAVTLAPDAKATPESIIRGVEPRLRHPARPAIVVITDILPRNAAGKVLKDQVKKLVVEKWKTGNAVRAKL